MSENTTPIKRQILDDLFDAYTILSRGAYVSLYDTVGQMTRYSPSCVEMFDLQSEYVPRGSDTWSDLVHPEDRARYESIMTKLINGTARYYDLHYRVRLKDGSYTLMRFLGSVLRDSGGKPEIIGGIIINEGLMENTDPITVLRNQYGFFQDLSAVMEMQKKCAILMIGISKMNDINEMHGYSYGNKVLQQIGWYLQESFGQSGKIYRIDGAKFALLTDTLDAEALSEQYEKIRQAFLNGLQVENVKQHLVSSGGMISVTGKAVDERTIFSSLIYICRESALHKNGRLVNFDGNFEDADHDSLKIIDEIRNSVLLNCAGFSLNYQLVVNAQNEKVTGVKANLNWRNEKYGEVPSEKYLSVLEHDFVFEELGYWTLRQVMLDSKKLLAKNPRLTISVDVVQVQLEDEYFIDEVQKIARQTAFPLKNLCLELNSSCRLLNMNFLKSIVMALRHCGIKIILNDFGSGLASIDFLRELSPEYIKFNQKYSYEFYKFENRMIVRCLAEMAAALGTKVLIEGVDNRHIRDELKNLPIDNFQGNFYSPKLPLPEIIDKI